MAIRRTNQSKSKPRAPPTMTPPESIALEINQIDEKKRKLKKAFDDLQAHRSLLSPSFNLSWSDIDSHFSSIQSSLSNRFGLLLQSDKTEPSPTLLWPQLRTFCENMDGNGLGKFMIDNSNKRLSIKPELEQAVRSSSNPAALVLDAIEGSYHCSPSSSSARAIDSRRIFVLLLEALLEIKPNLTNELRERARTLASDWRLNIGNKPSEALGFLHLIVVFELRSVFKMEEILDYVFLISKYKQATVLSKKLGLDKTSVAGLVQKLLHTGRLLAAISFIYEFEMTDRFRPVNVLKNSLYNSREAAKRVCAEGGNSLKAQNEGTDKELSALRLVIKVVKERNLELEFCEENLEECVQELENVRAQRRQEAAKLVSPANPPQKRPRVVNNLTTPTQSQQPPQLLPDHRHGLQQVNPFGFVNSTVPGVNVHPYGYPSAPYGSVASRPVYYEQQTGYGLRPQYQPPYYPQ
ncbi:Inactive FRIGIDA-like protein 2 [Hirschfeldia incana]|nr:Inactive FRIGIDA-like protein 2 [Hirschfeldia incana]